MNELTAQENITATLDHLARALKTPHDRPSLATPG